MNRKTASALVGVAVTVGLLWFALRHVNMDEVGATIKAARWRYIPGILAICWIGMLIRGARWKILVSRSADASVTQMAMLEAVGLAVNNVLFAKLGEVARVLLCARELKIPVATSLGSVAVERALDVTAMLVLFNLAAFAAPEAIPPAFRQIGFFGMLGSLTAVAVLAFAEKPLSPGGSLERLFKPIPKLHALVMQLAAGAAVLRSPAQCARVAALSLGLWLLEAWIYWSGAQAVDLTPALGYARSLLVLAWAGACTALPAAPGAFGNFEAAVQGIVVSFGSDASRAFGYAIFTHGVVYLCVTITGLICLYSVGLTLGGLKALSEEGK